MRILHVANFNNYKYGADLYASDRKISSGLIRNGHFVYDFSYRDICRSESLFRTTKLGTGKLNRKLIEACDTIHPHLLLLGHSELIETTTLIEIRKRHPDIKIALWYVDALFHKDKTRHVFERLQEIDVVFATTGGKYLQEYSHGKTRAAFFPNIVDPAVETGKSFELTEWAHDFIFCGRDSGDPQRQSFMEKLFTETTKHVSVAFCGCLGNPPLTGQAYLDFLGSSKMGLNISRRNDVELYSSDRLAQLVGNGLLTFCPRVPKMTMLFDESELVYFDDAEDLLEKIMYYQNNDSLRKKIAAKGWQKAHHSFNTTRVTAYMIEFLFQLPFSSEYEWQEVTYTSTGLTP